LVGDADGAHVARGEARRGESLRRDVALRGPYLERIVLNPPRLWEDLAEFLLGDSEDSAVPAEGDGAGARGPLVEG